MALRVKNIAKKIPVINVYHLLKFIHIKKNVRLKISMKKKKLK